MNKIIQYAFVLFFGFLNAQENQTHTLYFKFDKFDLDQKQIDELLYFVKQTDSSKIETIQIYGYTDDVGKEAYNITLSNKRANYIRKKMMENGVKTKIFLKTEGKGKILLVENIKQNINNIRSTNRRVDVLLQLKPIIQPKKIEIPKYYDGIQKNHIVGDKVNLEHVFFETGSSQLSDETKKELDIIVEMVAQSNIYTFEIQGHVCCVPPHQNEAIDKDTKKRGLSKNRAEAVYKYFISKNIPAIRMTYKGYGNKVPLGRGAEFDRRVEILVTKI